MMMNEAGRIASCCSLQTSLGPPEYRKWRRINGLQLPLHPQQVVGWVFLLLFAVATFLVLVPALGSALRYPILIVLSLLFTVHIGSHLTALLTDPADPHLRVLNTKVAVPEFDRTKHTHVIENGRCHLCNIRTANARTKHCSVCNKCVERFDHHCKWLNHCVGGRNYIAFLVCVVSAVVTSIVVVALSITELVLYHLDPVWLSSWEQHAHLNVSQSEETTMIPIHGNVFLVVIAALGTLATVSSGLLLHLCLFHMYISSRGLTTYEYIRSYRRNPGRGNSVAPSVASTVQLPIEPTVSSPGVPIRRQRYCCKIPERSGDGRSSSSVRYLCCDSTVEESLADTGRNHPWWSADTTVKCVQCNKNSSQEKTDETLGSYVDGPTSTNYLESSSSALKMSDTQKCSHHFASIFSRKPAVDIDEETPTAITPELNESKRQRKIECNKNSRKLCPCFQHQDKVKPVPSINVRSNQIRPSEDVFVEDKNKSRPSKDKVTTPTVPPIRRSGTLPALAPPKRRQIRNVLDLKELSDALAHVASLSQAEEALPNEVVKMAFTPRKTYRRNLNKDPKLSPIRESGFSNPSSPYLSTDRGPESPREKIFTIRTLSPHRQVYPVSFTEVDHHTSELPTL